VADVSDDPLPALIDPVDPREDPATDLAFRLSDLVFDALPVQGTVDGPHPWFAVQLGGEWFTVTVEARHPGGGSS
jgi:hypothetical protein